MAAQTWYLDTALACALYGLLAGQLVPALIARIPEPDLDPLPRSADARIEGTNAAPYG